MRYRMLVLFLVCLLLLVGCTATPAELPPLTEEVAVYETADYRLTYPAVFTLTREAEDAVYFTAEGRTMVFSLTREENPYGLLSVEGYCDAAGIYDGVISLDTHAFAVEKHLPDMLSGYFVYAFSQEELYLLEYNYGGTEEERALASLFEITIL